jgi:hypothetical protein
VQKVKIAVVVGGGITALEIVEGLVEQGLKVHYFLRGTHYRSNVLNETESEIVEAHLKKAGVQVHYNIELAEICALKAHAKLQDGTPFSCKDCHASGYASLDQAICSTCHAQIDAAAMQAHVAAYGTNCTACHDGIDSYGKAFDHNTVAFKLTGKHISLDCYACHKGDVKLADMKFTPTQCVACHHRPFKERLSFDWGAYQLGVHKLPYK